MMKILINLFLLLIILSGCKGIQWAENAQSTIHRKFPELEEQNCADRFPVIKDSVTSSDTVTHWANNIDYTALIDSLYTVAFNLIEPLSANDTCTSKLQPYLVKISALQNQVKYLKDQYRPCDTTYIHVNHRTVITEENTAKTAVYKRQADEANGSLKTWKIASFITGGLLLICIIALFIMISSFRSSNK